MGRKCLQVEIECARCGRKKMVKLSALKRGARYCSHECADAHANRGRVASTETRAAISAAMTGRKMSDETKAKVSANRTGRGGRPGKSNPMFGKRGEDSGHWKGGRVRHEAGYVRLSMPDHPEAHRDGYVLEHRIVMERMIGRPLLAEEVVHHKNGIRDDNREENLQLFASHSEHRRFHANAH